MIALPPGMTPEEYFATPAGRRAQAANERFAQDTARRQRAGRPRELHLLAGAAQPPSGMVPGPPAVQQDLNGDGVPDAQSFDMSWVPAKPAAGSAQPKQDPYASSTKAKGVNDIAREIEGALAEMAPELDPSERRLMAAGLAREYSQERQAAARELARGPAAEAPDLSRERKWDGNKYEYTDTPEYQARAEARKAQRMETEEQQARRVQLVRQQQMRNNVAMAQKSERDRPGSAGAFGQMAKKLGRPAAPGMAQPIQPQDQGTPYGEFIGTEAAYYGGDFVHRDRDGVDDRWQSAPGQPSRKPTPGRRLKGAPADWGTGAGYAKEKNEKEQALRGMGPRGSAHRQAFLRERLAKPSG